jgi:hypothetical protein
MLAWLTRWWPARNIFLRSVSFAFAGVAQELNPNIAENIDGILRNLFIESPSPMS